MFNRIILTACAFGMTALASTPATALEIMNSEESVTVEDLDLSTKAGRETLDRRLETAVRKACGDRPAIRDYEAMAEYRLCIDNARASYKSQLSELVGKTRKGNRVAVLADKLSLVAMR